MKRMILAAVVVCSTVLATTPVFAQRGGRGGGMRPSADMIMLGLLRSEAVQEEVEIMPDQLEALEKIGENVRGERPDMSRIREASEEEREQMFAEMRSKMEERMKEAREDVQQVLLPEQLERLNEIALQMMGTAALTDPKIVAELKITDEQKEKMQAIQEETRDSFRELFRSGDREQIREKMTEAREQEQEKILAVLTSEQKEKFEAMKGKPSEAVTQMQEQRGRGGFGGRGGRGGGDGQRGGRGGRGDRDGGGERSRPEAE